MEKIILRWLLHYCEKIYIKNGIIPAKQVLGKENIQRIKKKKKKFSRRTNTLGVFFDVKKAYDSVCGTPDYFTNWKT